MHKVKLEKLEGLKLFRENGIPVLSFEILSKNSFEEQIKKFMAELGVDKFMIRTDGKGRFTPSINFATLSEHVEQIKDFLNKDFTVFIMHPSQIFRNFHSLNVMKEDAEIIVEVVGPGFMATDLCRHGNIHEEIIIDANNYKVISRHILAAPVKYKKEIEIKIKALGMSVLEENRSYLLEYAEYPPLDDKALDYVKGILPKLEIVSKHLSSEKYVASMSFVDLGDGSNQPIFWDIYGIR